MCKVLPLLDPRVHAVYVEAAGVKDTGSTPTRLLSLGNAVWDATRAKLNK